MKALLIVLAATACFSCTRTADSSSESSSPMNSTRDTHTYAQPDEARVRHLDWEARVDFEKKQLDAVARLDITTAEKAHMLILDTKKLNISRVTLGREDEEITTFTLGDYNEHMGSPLHITIKPRTQRVNVYYTTSPGAEALQWLSPRQTAGKKHPFLFSQSQAILARSWVPIQDSPGIRFTYTASLQVPAELMAVMSADNPVRKNAEGIYKFKMEQAIPAYLLALAVGDLEFEALGTRTGVYAEPGTLEKAAYEFAELEEMLEAAEMLYGPYRWKRYDLLVLPPSFPFGGMENPRLTFATPTILAGDRSLTSLVAHELAHSWSGNLVTNANWNDFWLNEGFTVYFERRIMEALYGSAYADMLTVLGAQDLGQTMEQLKAEGKNEDTRLQLNLEGRNPDDAVTDVAYEKGYFFLRHLESLVGREKWDTFLREYFEQNAFRSMTTETFIAYLNEHLLEPNNISAEQAAYEAWIFEEGLPADMQQPVSTRFQAVEAQLLAWQNGKAARDLVTEGWSSHEWQHFLRKLPADLTIEQMKELDAAFGFSQSGNAEELAAWFMHAITHEYQAAYPALEQFLLTVGRRKFLVPLYRALAQSEEGKKKALAFYRRARPYYHFVSVNSIDKILGYEELMEE